MYTTTGARGAAKNKNSAGWPSISRALQTRGCKFLSNVDPNVAFRSGKFSLDAMAFRRHLVAFASTPQGLQQRLDDLAAFPTPRGLTINTGKSFTLSLRPSGREKCKIITTRPFYINGEPLPVSNVASVWWYLGISFPPDGTKSNGVEIEFAGLLERERWRLSSHSSTS